MGHGVVAPWVVFLLGFGSKSFIPTAYMSCEGCSINFFSYRYSEVELGAIYKDYRKDSWFNLRNSFEPWYRRTTNNAYIDENASTNIATRSSYTEGLLSLAGLDISDLGDYLDFGGDNGQFFPRGVKGRRILFDLQAGMNDGVETITDIANLGSQVDVVSNCYVLEHISDIESNINQMKSCLVSGGHLLIELPFDIFRVSRFHKSFFYERYLRVVYRRRSLFIFLDFITGISRQFFNRIPSLGIVKQSEHINYFNLESIEIMLKDRGFTIKSSSKPERKSFVGFIKQGKFGLVAQKNE